MTKIGVPSRFSDLTLQSNFQKMFRTHSCGELHISHLNQKVTLSGWVSVIRDKGFMIWIDLRDRYGITQLILDEQRSDKTLSLIHI